MANSILDQHEDVFSLPEDVLNSFVQSASLDVDHLVGALGLEIGKSSQPPAPSEGKPPLPQPALPTSQARLRSWRGLALSCLRGNQLVLCFKRQSAIALQVCLSNVNNGNCLICCFSSCCCSKGAAKFHNASSVWECTGPQGGVPPIVLHCFE